jgi:hypothetical protein
MPDEASKMTHRVNEGMRISTQGNSRSRGENNLLDF